VLKGSVRASEARAAFRIRRERGGNVIDADLFRNTMRQLASGVTIITGTTDAGEPFAMTATAFLPVSIDPPLILISVEQKNDTHALIERTESFGVTLLSESQSDLSTRYARKDERRYKFDDVDTFLGPNGSIFFSGCAAAIEAGIEQRVPGGDHTLFLGRVSWMSVFAEARPLVYYQARYHQVVGIDNAVSADAKAGVR
jgi:flavin reductase (DIM6/NTAB) family NADH-FMN oxidoreductase RutF